MGQGFGEPQEWYAPWRVMPNGRLEYLQLDVLTGVGSVQYRSALVFGWRIEGVVASTTS